MRRELIAGITISIGTVVEGILSGLSLTGFFGRPERIASIPRPYGSTGVGWALAFITAAVCAAILIIMLSLDTKKDC